MLRKSYLLATIRKIHYIYNEDISSAKWLDHAGRVIPPETMEGAREWKQLVMPKKS
jgi:hypothetical protein